MHFIKRLFWHMQHEKDFLGWAVSRFLFCTGIGRLFIIDCGSYKIRFFSSAISLTKWFDPSYGQEDEQFMRKILRAGDIVIDVGANIGSITLAAASMVGAQGRVIAFEPNPRIFIFLTKNVRLNRLDNVTLYNCAVGDKKGEVSLSCPISDDVTKIVPQSDQKTSMATLDEKVSLITGRIRLLKVDVEGYEKFVLLGAAKTLERTDYVYLEVFEDNFAAFNYTTGELIKTLQDFDFCFYRIDEKGNAITIGADFIPDKCMNIVGKRKGI